MAATKAVAVCIARGTSNAAFTQLVSNAVTTRSGTTATLTMASTATLTTGNTCLIQGHDLDEYNGIFTITVPGGGTTITYTISADPGASSTSTVMTVDKCTLGTAVDLSTDYGGDATVAIQNGNTTLGAAAEIWIGYSYTLTSPPESSYLWTRLAYGDTAAKSLTRLNIPVSGGSVNFAIARNTTGPVDCGAAVIHTTAV